MPCSRCGRPLKIVSLIDAPSVIERILRHLKLWDRPERPPPTPTPRTLDYDVETAAWEDDVGSPRAPSRPSNPAAGIFQQTFGANLCYSPPSAKKRFPIIYIKHLKR